jgi:hypothetical protein
MTVKVKLVSYTTDARPRLRENESSFTLEIWTDKVFVPPVKED